ncbi:hypothetical protein J7E50_05500 [Pedobacter sp. ISL-68]|uniref:hypothetical protein n=1 Tax=unclassified Pedobacter TaxID=2628915 RepID=UPI001BE58E8F|nr:MULTISPECIES: hypothetical protein [unclassified Pedobacter]MBT2563771.1 hypothetical protein [Pedobacter sp. ISL-64]MBT2589663.1 hypothetical protein [Pedobacter sp. ISL-68]
MKKVFEMSCVLTVLGILGACKIGNNKKDFIPGMYVSDARGEFALASDTLVFSVGAGENSYSIERRTGYQLITEGRPGKREWGRESWTGIFDARSGLVQEMRKGRVIRFVPDSAYLVIGRRVYRKVR